MEEENDDIVPHVHTQNSNEMSPDFPLDQNSLDESSIMEFPAITEEQNDQIDRLLGPIDDSNDCSNLDVSLLSSFKSDCSQSFTASNKKDNSPLSSQKKLNFPKIPSLDLSKIVAPVVNHAPNFSLNLSAISGNQSVNHITPVSSLKLIHHLP